MIHTASGISLSLGYLFKTVIDAFFALTNSLLLSLVSLNFKSISSRLLSLFPGASRIVSLIYFSAARMSSREDVVGVLPVPVSACFLEFYETECVLIIIIIITRLTTVYVYSPFGILTFHSEIATKPFISNIVL